MVVGGGVLCMQSTQSAFATRHWLLIVRRPRARAGGRLACSRTVVGSAAELDQDVLFLFGIFFERAALAARSLRAARALRGHLYFPRSRARHALVLFALASLSFAHAASLSPTGM